MSRFGALLENPDFCTELDEWNEPCGKTAVAAAWDDEGAAYAVCKHHAIRSRTLVTLYEIVVAAEQRVDGL